MSFETAVNLASSILSLAGVYALVNLGFVLLYRTTGIINFAQGHFMLVAALLMTTLGGIASFWPRLLLVALGLGALSVLVYLVLMRFLLGAEEFPKVITTLMLATVLTQGAAMIWGVSPRTIETPTDAVIALGDAQVPVMDLIIVGLAGAMVVALILFVNHTITGSRMRALADNETLAVFSGMRVHVLAGIAWGVTGAGAAVAGVVYAQRSGVGLELPLVGLGAFPAAVIGGMDSLTGIAPAALLVAAAQTLAVYYLGAVWGNIAGWMLMLATLLLLPQGLFGVRELKRL